jgi:glutathione S-transferase
MTATPCLIGRSSSHFTRVPRMLALELGIDLAFRPVYDLGSRHVADYGGNPAMKLPVLRLAGGQAAFGAENIARTLAELVPGRLHTVWTEQLPGVEARNMQELVWHAMAAQVQLVFGTQAAKLPADNLYFVKAAEGMANVLAWLDAHVDGVLATLPPSRNLSLLELTLFCLIEHLRFRSTVALDAYGALSRFTDAFGRRDSAQHTAYRFDVPPAA